jgi:mono/diheme cytochrome c family protein
MKRFTWICMLACSILTAITAAGNADESSVHYLRAVKPVLKSRCYACHGALKQESELRLDTGRSILKGGSSGPAVVAGMPDVSEIFARVISADATTRMPPEGAPLTAVEIAQIRQWIAHGANSLPDEVPESDPREHWAFQKPLRPKVPVVAGQQSTNSIDAFIAVQRTAQGITAMPPTDRATLLRRVYLDLIGLPPSAEELQTFLKEDSQTAYETIVDKLLASPQHGERWGRHWMDVWRYSDWYGRRMVPDVMNSYPMLWRWRDWIVRSINENKPYDQMIVEMLAADEVLATDDPNIVATGYLVRSWFKWNYETWKKDLVEHTGKAFLGITLNCAQCHDHKYDPLAQEEYFRFRAFFEPLELRHDRVVGETDPGMFKKYVYNTAYGPIKSGMVRVFDEYFDAETWMFSKGDSRLKIEGKPAMTPGAPAVLGGDQLQMARLTLPIEAAYPGMKEFIKSEERSKRHVALQTALKDRSDAKLSLSAESPELRDELQAAEAGFQTARENAIRLLSEAYRNANSQVLEGRLSLLLDAESGRRALSHTLPGIDALADNTTVSYLVQIIQDGHTNLRLALDIAQGATGGIVVFENGNVKTYTPGGVHEFVAGTYDLSKGQNRFSVQLKLNLAQNHFLLTVTSLADNVLIVNAVPSALNGWKPQADGRRGLFLDCRPGTEAIYDALAFAQPDGTTLLSFDFESPSYVDGQDVVETPAAAGCVPWMLTGLSQAPATSKVASEISLNADVRAAVKRLTVVRQSLRLPALKIDAAEARTLAAELESKSLNHRIEADAVRYATGLLSEDKQAEPAVKALIHAACQSEREAAVATFKASLITADAAIAEAEVNAAAAGKANNQKEIDAANTANQTAQNSRAAATNSLTTAQENLSKELGEYTALSGKYPQVTSGRRSALARWIANKDNPLTARVAVNHLWRWHFNQAIVETTHDLGRNGSRPTHPEFFDWLACELMDSGWSMKHVHRLIVTSQTYQLASMLPRSAAEASLSLPVGNSVDPDNRTYWRFPASRMQAEVVRDSLLSIAGDLETTIGGHEIDHKHGLTSHRRSLYFAHHGEEKMEFLELFDAANACDCYKRTSSVQPQQALALSNSELTNNLSRQLAKRLTEKVQVAETDVDDAFVGMAFLQVLNRAPRGAERAASKEFLEQQAKRLAVSSDGHVLSFDPAIRARENLIHALMNHNDFVTVR